MINEENKIVAGIFVAAFLVRSFIIIFAAQNGLFQTWEYETIANNILNGAGYTIEHLGVVHYAFGPPLYPLFSALVYSMTNHNHLALGLIQAFFSAATCMIIFKIGKKIFDRRVGFLAAVITVLHPGLVLYLINLHSFNVDIFLFASLVLILLKAKETALILWFILLGVIGGLCILSRSTVFLFLPVAFIFLWLKSSDKKKLLRYFIISSGIILVIIGPWIVRNYIVLKRFIFIQEAGEVFWRGNNPNATGTAFTIDGKPMINTSLIMRFPGLSGLDQDRLFWNEGFKFVNSHPVRFIVLILKKFYYFWWFSPHSGIWYPYVYRLIYKIIYINILLFAILGVMSALVSKIPQIKEGTYLMLIFFFTTSIAQSLFYVEGRHRLAIEPLLLIFTAKGLLYVIFRTKMNSSIFIEKRSDRLSIY